MMVILLFALGFLAGALFGIFTLALLSAGRDDGFDRDGVQNPDTDQGLSEGESGDDR